MYKLFIFDNDETLVKSRVQCFNALNTAINMSGGNSNGISMQEFEMYDDSGDYIGLYNKYNINNPVAKDIFFNEFFENCKKKIEFHDGAVELLNKLRSSGIKTAIATNAPTKRVQELMTHHGASDMFDMVCGIGSARPKPAGDMITEIMVELGMSPSETVMIGDRDVDILAGKNAGVATIAVMTGRINKKILLNSKPDMVVNTLQDIIDGKIKIIY